MIQKRKLAYFLHDIAVGGAEVAFLSALPALHQAFDLKVFVLGNVDPKLIGRFPEPIQRCIVCLGIKRWALVFHLPRIYYQLRLFRPEIIVSSLWRSTIPAVLYKRLNGGGVRYMVLMHSSDFFHWADRLFTCRAIRVADAIFADAQATAAFARTLVGKSKIPIITLSYLTDPTPSRPVEHEYAGAKRFCYVGKLHQIKRITLAISAIKWLRDKGIDATLDIFGRDEGAGTSIHAQIIQLGLAQHVHVHEEIAPFDKTRVYGTFPFYIQLSVQEGMAMSVAEAMQHGMVCAVTAVGEIPNYTEDGVSAILLDPATPGSWESSLNRLLAVLQDEGQCRSISHAAHQVFKGTAVFSESFISAVNESAT